MSEDYNKAKRIGEKQWNKAAAEGKDPALPSLDVLVPEMLQLNEVPIGLVEIPIDMIAGTRTRGRTSAFSADYYPILSEKSEFAMKWSNLVRAQLTEGIRDAIKVYEYMQRFYVEEGNKRVSVLKYLGVPVVLGDVIRLEPLPADTKEYRIYKEFEQFYAVAPFYELSFSEEGRYARLASYMDQNLEETWPAEILETVRSAYQYFKAIYLEKGGARLPITVGDAFLVYLSIYSADSLLSESRQVLARRVEHIWNEFLVTTTADNIALVETPEEAEKPKKENLLLSIGGILKKAPLYTAEHPLRAAFIYEKTPENSRWTYGHELGRNQLEQAFGGIVKTSRYENCSDDESFVKAVEEAKAHEDEMVFTISPSQMRATLREAVAHPEMRFLNCSVNLSHSAVRTYYGRMYEAKFLLGALAASVADNHKIGYRATSPIYGTIANINAFAIGAAIVDPLARIYLSWISKEDEDWRQWMREEGVRVQSGPDLIKPEEPGREYGLYQVDEGGNVFNLAMPVWDWGRYYELIIGTVINGAFDERRGPARKDQALNYWYGMSSGVIDVILSDKISYYSRKLVTILKKAVIADTLSPFDGELRSQEEIVKAADSPRLSNRHIITMDYLNDNVIGSIPKIEEITDEKAKETVKVSGVKEGQK
jgi:basic membrane lipoprotein Med (substrate-binding protein (PBP1-ABC) superfamily)